MKLVQDLPEIFEEFGEKRREAFLEVKEYKDKGVPVVGMYCAYFPTELAMAVGAIPVGLCSFSNETVTAAERELPKSMCPLVKSSYGFAIEDKCPFFHFADLVIGETTCDGKKKMYELMAEFKPVFVMELPNYRMPGAKSVLRLIWDKAKDFITRAFTVIFIASLIIWFLQTFSITFNIVSDSKDSILALIGGVIAPIFAPLGFGDWRASTALITGFTAKESVVSTMTVLLGGSPVATMFNTHSAIVFLVFTLLYTPCVAAITSVKRELGGKWAIGVVALQCGIAWIIAFLVNLILIVAGV